MNSLNKPKKQLCGACKHGLRPCTRWQQQPAIPCGLCFAAGAYRLAQSFVCIILSILRLSQWICYYRGSFHLRMLWSMQSSCRLSVGAPDQALTH